METFFIKNIFYLLKSINKKLIQSELEVIILNQMQNHENFHINLIMYSQL